MQRLANNSHHSFKEMLLFFKAFLKNPTHVGALAPSSRHLAIAMTSFRELSTDKVVIELGCGTGSITELILQRLPSGAKYIGIELNSECFHCLKEHFPGAVFYNGSAENMQRYMAEQNIKEVDAIISGLPWAVLPEQMQNKIFSEIVHSLTPQGVFVTFAYSHAKMMSRAMRLKRRLKASFNNVEISATVWKNFPPAFFYICRKPKKENNINTQKS